MRIVVVGAGLLGLSAAFFLSRSGNPVTVLERRTGCGLETSFANGGMLTPSQAEPWNSPGILMHLLHWLGRDDAPVLLRPRMLFNSLGWGMAFLRNSSLQRYLANTARNGRLAQYSLRLLGQLRDALQLEFQSAQTGTMKIFRDPSALDDARVTSDVLQQLGLRQVVLDRDGLLNLEPALEPVIKDYHGGIHYPDDESGDARLFCNAMYAHLAGSGVEFMFDTGVSGFVAGQGRVHAIRTGAGDVGGDVFVICAGSYTPAIMAELPGPAVPIRPVKGYSISVAMEGWRPSLRVPLVDEARHLAATPLGKVLRIAGTAEFGGFSTDIDPARIANLTRFLARTFPREFPAGPPDDISAWCGLRPYSCDGVPIVGVSGHENLFINAGHGHLGWTMAVGSGCLVADLVEGREPVLDPADYSLQRFRR